MQYHALALAETGAMVDLIGYAGTPPSRAVRDNQRIGLHQIPPPTPPAEWLPGVVWVAASVLRRCRQGLQLLWLLLFGIASPEIILVQNPPAIPTLLVGLIAAYMRSAVLVVDWHNFAYSVLALKLGSDRPAVRLARLYERWLGRAAAKHLCVSEAMRKELATHWGISEATVLYDRPAAQFTPLSSSARDDFLHRLGPALGFPIDGASRPALVVSPTGWTEDEDYSMLLEAAVRCERLIALHEPAIGKPAFPDLVIVLSGVGPLRGYYEAKIQALGLTKVHLRTIWLEAEDYPLMLGSADLGLCCHRSSSGLDLPMKIADMFGAALPVLAFDYGPCLKEQVREGENGLLFKDAESLADRLYELFKTFPRSAPVLEDMRAKLLTQPMRSWSEGWKAEAAALFARDPARG